MRKVRLIMLLGLVMSLAVFGGSPVQAAPGDILVYTGNAALNEGYSLFGTAAGRPVVVSGVLPPDITPNSCVILPINALRFSAAQKAQFLSFVQGGGTLIALAEHGGFPGSISTMNDLADGLGSTMDVVSAFLDGGFNNTTNINPDPLTTGVTRLRYAAGSEVTPGASGRRLVRFNSAPTRAFIAAQQLGSGEFVLSGDSNWASNNSGGAYTDPTVHNAQFAKNLCGVLPTTLAANPVIANVDTLTVYLTLSARLTRTTGGSPVSGQTIAFSAGGPTLCSGVTNANGDASCGAVVEIVAVVLNLGTYDATFAGASRFGPSSDSASLLVLAGGDIP
ncbi:MAG: hypothetical protein ACRDJM_00780 [Actinomycetota bacterium]